MSKQPIVADTPKPLTEQLIANDTTIPTVDNKEPPLPKLKTHLQDTTFVEGSFILFLRPNESRYAELESISEEGLGGPLVIDRDTVNYGFIMSAKGKDIAKAYNSVRSGDYTEEIDSYFLGKGI